MLARLLHGGGAVDVGAFEKVLQHAGAASLPCLVVDVGVLGAHTGGVGLVVTGLGAQDGQVGVQQHFLAGVGRQVIGGCHDERIDCSDTIVGPTDVVEVTNSERGAVGLVGGRRGLIHGVVKEGSRQRSMYIWHGMFRCELDHVPTHPHDVGGRVVVPMHFAMTFEQRIDDVLVMRPGDVSPRLADLDLGGGHRPRLRDLRWAAHPCDAAAMAVLIDEPRWWFHGRRWSHLVSDLSLDELHAFADRTGIPRRGFQGDHYDVPEEFRDELLAAGAELVESRELVRRLRAAGLRLSPAERRARTASPPLGLAE